MNKDIPDQIQAEERGIQIQLLKSQGYTYRQIAEKLTISIGTVHNDLKLHLKRLKEINLELAEERRDMCQDKLDELSAVLAPSITSGVTESGDPIPNYDTIDRVLKIVDKEREMWGTDAPKRTEVETKDVRDFGTDSSRKQAFDRFKEKYGAPKGE